jgi:hypothetical protein
MPVVAEKQLQGVLARAQRNFGLSLPSPKVQMIEVARNFLIQGRQRAVYEKVMVAAIGPGIPCGGYFYPARAKSQNRIRRYVCALLQVQKENFGIGRRRGSVRWLDIAGQCCCRRD